MCIPSTQSIHNWLSALFLDLLLLVITHTHTTWGSSIVCVFNLLDYSINQQDDCTHSHCLSLSRTTLSMLSFLIKSILPSLSLFLTCKQDCSPKLIQKGLRQNEKYFQFFMQAKWKTNNQTRVERERGRVTPRRRQGTTINTEIEWVSCLRPGRATLSQTSGMRQLARDLLCQLSSAVVISKSKLRSAK